MLHTSPCAQHAETKSGQPNLSGKHGKNGRSKNGKKARKRQTPDLYLLSDLVFFSKKRVAQRCAGQVGPAWRGDFDSPRLEYISGLQ